MTICGVCGASFEARRQGQRGGRPRKYCSEACAAQANRRMTQERAQGTRPRGQRKASKIRNSRTLEIKSYTLPAFAEFCKRLILDNGQAMELEPFQQEMLRDHFEGATELVVIIPKKNGKTTLLAALGLFHLLVIRDAEAVVVAASRDQASVLYNQAVGLIRRSDLHDTFAVRVGYREIRLHGLEGPKLRDAGAQASGSRFRVLSADASTADGVIPTLALVDELHRHRNADLYGVLRDGLGPRAGRMITISTAGSTEDSPLGKLRSRAHAFTGVKRSGAHLRASDGAFVLHEWALAPEQDPEDLDAVLLANPASWQTRPALQARFESPTMTVGQWLRYACGIWTAGEEPEIRPSEWDALRVDIGVLEDGDAVWLAPSVGDNAAIGIASCRPDDRVAVGAVVLERREGHSLLVDVEQVCLELGQRYNVVGFLDPGRAFERSGDILEDSGLPRVQGVWSPQRKMAATGTFLRMLRDNALMHDGDSTLRDHILKLTLRSAGGEEYMDVNAYDRAAAAVAMAVHHAVANDGPPPRIHIYREASS